MALLDRYVSSGDIAQKLGCNATTVRKIRETTCLASIIRLQNFAEKTFGKSIPASEEMRMLLEKLSIKGEQNGQPRAL